MVREQQVGQQQMELTVKKLWNRDFTLLMAVQIIALFSNSILSFILPLHILNVSGSPALFGTVLALASIPFAVMTPIGGVIADRGKKQRIMFWLDLFTMVVILLFITASGFLGTIVPLVIVKVMALNVIQGIYTPTAMSAIRFLVPEDKLIPANAAGSMVFTLSNAVGPVVGSILYVALGLSPVLMASAALFVVTAIMDLFIRIPFKKAETTTGAAQMLKGDMFRAIRFGVREMPILGNVTLIMFLFSISSVAMIIVGLPVLVTQTLGLDMELLGISQGIMMGGGVLGGIIAGSFEKRITIKQAHWLLMICALFTIPMGLVFLFAAPVFVAYVVITLSCVVIMLTTQVVFIQVLAFVQMKTPTEFVGKAVAVVMAFSFISYPIGQFLFGMLLERFDTLPWIAMFVAAFMSAIIAVWSRRHFSKIPVDHLRQGRITKAA